MPPKTSFVSESILRTAPLPNHGKKYAVVPHGYVIDETRKALAAAGFTTKRELYKTSKDGQMAFGIYHLNYGTDKDMGLMFAWCNSYNKMLRFKCSIGTHVFVCDNSVVDGDICNYNRKHIGTSALGDVTNSINTQIGNAGVMYNNLVAQKEVFKNVILSPSQQGRVLGELFAAEEVLTLTQVGVVKREMDKPSHNYNCDPNSAWAMYNHITFALKESHPLHFLNDHEAVHSYFINQFGQLIVPGNQPEPIAQKNTDTTNEDSEISLGVNFL